MPYQAGDVYENSYGDIVQIKQVNACKTLYEIYKTAIQATETSQNLHLSAQDSTSSDLCFSHVQTRTNGIDQIETVFVARISALDEFTRIN